MVDELAVAHVLLAAVALISCLSVPDKRTIRSMPRAVWVAVIVLVPLVGSIGWFVAGRPHHIGPPHARWERLLGQRVATRPPAPDDDPEFLRSLDQPTIDEPPGPSDPPESTEDGQHRPGSGPEGPPP